jgi:hypothetical protein
MAWECGSSDEDTDDDDGKMTVPIVLDTELITNQHVTTWKMAKKPGLDRKSRLARPQRRATTIMFNPTIE